MWLLFKGRRQRSVFCRADTPQGSPWGLRNPCGQVFIRPLHDSSGSFHPSPLSLSVPLNPEFPLAKDSLYAFSGWLQGTEYVSGDRLLNGQ